MCQGCHVGHTGPMAPLTYLASATMADAVIRAYRKDCTMSTTTTYVIPSVTDKSRSIVASAEALLKDDATHPAHVALGLDVAPNERESAKREADAAAALKREQEQRATLSRLRFDGVRLAYSYGQVGKGKVYAGQRDLARALGMTQGRVSQILS